MFLLQTRRVSRKNFFVCYSFLYLPRALGTWLVHATSQLLHPDWVWLASVTVIMDDRNCHYFYSLIGWQINYCIPYPLLITWQCNSLGVKCFKFHYCYFTRQTCRVYSNIDFTVNVFLKFNLILMLQYC